MITTCEDCGQPFESLASSFVICAYCADSQFGELPKRPPKLVDFTDDVEAGEALVWLIDYCLNGGTPISHWLEGSRWPAQLQRAKAKLLAAGYKNPYPDPEGTDGDR